MERQGEEVHVTTAEARGGSTPHIVRYVLLFSLVLAILALSAVWIIGAVTVDRQEDTSSLASPAPTQS